MLLTVNPWRLRAMPSITAWKHSASITKNVRIAERIFFSLNAAAVS